MSVTLQERPQNGAKTGTEVDAVAERSLSRSIARRGLRKLTFNKPEFKSLYECGQPVPGVEPATLDETGDNVSIGNLIRCGNKHICPSCAGTGRLKDTATVAWRANQQIKTGGGLTLLTLAPRHALGEALEPQMRCLNESFASMLRSKNVREVFAEYGVVGHVKVLEPPYGANGWHPHLHVLLFHESFIDITEGEGQRLKFVIWEMFNQHLKRWAHKAATKSKRHVTPIGGKRRKETNAEFYELPDTWRKDASWRHGIDLTPIKPDNAGASKIAAYCGKIQLEMTRSDLKLGRVSTSRSPFQILYDYGNQPTPQDAALLLEFIAASKGTHLVSWSGIFKGKNPLHGDVPEDFYQKALDEHAEANGYTTDKERRTVAGIETRLHLHIDNQTADTGNPLIWELTNTYRNTRNLNAVIELLNRNLTKPVRLDHDTDHRYPIIAWQTQPEKVPANEERLADYLHEHKAEIREQSRKRREPFIEKVANQWKLLALLRKHQLTREEI